MTFDDGILRIYDKANIAEKGDIPKYVLRLKSSHYFGFETLGYNRVYSAKKADQQIDALVRIDFDMDVNINDICILEDSSQYRCTFVQHPEEDGLRFTRITLEEEGTRYDIE